MRTVVALALLAASAAPLLGRDPSRIAAKDAPPFAELAPPGEPGQPLEIRGTVYAADGATAIPGASVYVYQTDAKGYYRPDDAMGNRDPRLFALLRTDASGRYSFRTIRPGSYPGTRVVQHIHYEVTAEGHGSRIFEIVFDDDPFMSDAIRRRAAEPGSIYSLRRLEPAAGHPGRIAQDVVLPGP